MKDLLNRISWIVSIIFGLNITSLLGIQKYEFFMYLLLSGIFASLTKYFLLNESYIESSLSKMGSFSFHEPETIIKKEVPASTVSPISPTSLNVQLVENTNNILIQDPFIEKKESQIPKDTTPNFIEVFFKENVLAKIGGILLFLGVLFFLSLVYTYLTPLGKFILGILIGILFYSAGVVIEKKGYMKEGLTLMGVGILVNYLVILGGRYIIETMDGAMLLSSSLCFLLLIINSLFSIITSFFYKSQNLLLFSFAVAYLNPLLIGAPKVDTPYGLLGYNTLLTGAAFFLSTAYSNIYEKGLIRYLLYTGFIGGNILALIAPLNTHESLGFILKIFSTTLISLFPIFMNRETISKNEILNYTIIGYIFLFLNVFGFSGSGDYFLSIFSYLGFLGTLIVFFIAIFLFGIQNKGEKGLDFPLLLLAPFIFFMVILFTQQTTFLFIPTILITFIGYLFIFTMLGSSFSKNTQTSLLFILGAILLIFNGAFFIKTEILSNLLNYVSIFITIGIFYIFCMYKSWEKDFSIAYSIGSIASIILAFPIVKLTGVQGLISCIALIVFALGNIGVPFLNTSLKTSGKTSTLIGLTIGSLFIAFESYRFIWFNPSLFGIDTSIQDIKNIIGILYIILGLLYLGMSYIYSLKNNVSLSIQIPNTASSIFYNYAIIGLSFIPLGIINIFGMNSGVTSCFWLLEVTMLLAMYMLTNSKNIFYFAMCVMCISLLPFLSYANTIGGGEYKNIFNLGFIGAAFIANIYFISKSKIDAGKETFFHITQYLFFGILFITFISILPHRFEIENISLSLYIGVLSIFYGLFHTSFSKSSFPFIYIIALCFHVLNMGYHIEDISRESINYGATFIFGVSYYLYSLYTKEKNYLMFWGCVIYSIIATTFYLEDFFNNYFAITIYWGILFFTLLSVGIQKDIQKMRTFGLYILILLLMKILFFDIWSELDGSLARVIALMFVGGVMIYVSMLYSKSGKYKLKNDLSLESFFPPAKEQNMTQKNTTPVEKKAVKKVNQDIKSVDVSNIKSISLYPNGEKKIELKGVNFFKIAKLILTSSKKTSFSPNELKTTYTYIIDNYESQLPEKIYTQAKTVLKNFVEKGGRVEIIYKDK